MAGGASEKGCGTREEGGPAAPMVTQPYPRAPATAEPAPRGYGAAGKTTSRATRAVWTVWKAGEAVCEALARICSQVSFRKLRFFRCGSLVSAFSAFSVRFPIPGHPNQVGEVPKTVLKTL